MKTKSVPTLVVEEVVPVPDGSNGDVLDAVRELTSTVSDLVETIEEMRKEYGLKKRAGVFTGKDGNVL